MPIICLVVYWIGKAKPYNHKREEEAIKASEAAKTVFASGGISENMPTLSYSAEQFAEGIDIKAILVDAKMCSSSSDARRNVDQGGVSINDVKTTDVNKKITDADLNEDGVLIIKKGKKSIYKIVKA